MLFCVLLIKGAILFVKGGSFGSVSEKAFEKIEVGMTKDHVESLMGKNESSRILSKKVRSGKEYWEYGYVSGVKQGPSPKAYVIWFKDNKVENKRKPIE